jgi:hypothetical protein
VLETPNDISGYRSRHPSGFFTPEIRAIFGFLAGSATNTRPAREISPPPYVGF